MSQLILRGSHMKKNILLILLVTLFSWHGQAYAVLSDEQAELIKLTLIAQLEGEALVNTRRAYEALKIIRSTEESSEANDLNAIIICQYIIESTAIINASDDISDAVKDGLKLVDNFVGGVANIHQEKIAAFAEKNTWIVDKGQTLKGYSYQNLFLVANLDRIKIIKEFPNSSVGKFDFDALILSLQQRKILADIHNNATEF